MHAGAQGGVATKDTVIDAARGCVRGVVAHVVGKAVIYGVDAILRRASTNGNAGGHVGDDQANALSRLEPQVSEEEANAARCRDLHALREHLGDPHTQADNRDEEEDDALDKHRSHRSLPRDGTGAAEAHNIVGEISVQAHAGGQGEGQVGEEAHASACDRSRQRSDGHELAPEIFHARVVLAIVEATGFGAHSAERCQYDHHHAPCSGVQSCRRAASQQWEARECTEVRLGGLTALAGPARIRQQPRIYWFHRRIVRERRRAGRQDAQQAVAQRTPLQQTANKAHRQTGEDVAERDERGGPGAELGAEGAATLRQLEEFVDSLHV